MDWGLHAPKVPARGAPPTDGECHVWTVPVAVDDATSTSWHTLLDDGERQRSRAIVVTDARRMFVASRAVTRLVAAHYQDADPATVRIRRVCEHCGDPGHGRPTLVDAGVDYSVSHSGEWLVIAVIGAGRIGVDLEYCRAMEDLDRVAARVLAAGEGEEFRAVPAAERTAWFYRTWTRKEAAVKLTGHGLAAELSGIDVSGPVVSAASPPGMWPEEPICLRDLAAPAGYAAALAHTGRVHTVLTYPLGPRR
jgi:4'-phosphopantetheinyl transferase